MKQHLLATALAFACLGASAQPSPPASAPLPVADYVKLPQYMSPRLSPNGKSLSVLVPVAGRMNLAVLDLDTRKGTALTNFSEFDVLNPVWVGERIVFTLGQLNSPSGPQQFDGGGLFVVARDGKDFRKLSPTARETRGSGNNVYRGLEFAQRIPGSPDEILATGNLRSQESTDLYRVNLTNGRSQLVTSTRPDRTTDFVLDGKLVPRVAKAWIKDTRSFAIHYRENADAPWREIERVDEGKGETFDPIGFLADDKTMTVLTNRGRDTAAIVRYDPASKQIGEVLAQHPRYDMAEGAAILEPDTNRLLGYSVQAEKPQRVWLDEKEGRTQAVIDRALPKTSNTFVRLPDSSRLLVTSYADVSPARFYILDEEKKTLEELFSSQPWLDERHLVEMRPFLLKTRDGLEIPSYYFLPKGYKAGDKLPTVVHIHGGPSVRADVWARGFGVAEAQILASRGYAVVLPNFRVTPGFGSKIHTAGFGTLGKQMSEDHEDAAKWAVDQGFADPGRMCISGASYGGYAVLRALAKTPGLFQCGVAGLVVSDVEMQVSSTAGDTSSSPTGELFWNQLAGKSDSNRTALRDASPVHQAALIKAPVFFYAGSADVRTPLEQTTAMVRALERAGNPPKTVMVAKGEGHGFGKVENNLELYEKMLRFLDENIGPNAKR
jgi:dipeptidyl aminopeptidase/acylaminoacyl peptidase